MFHYTVIRRLCFSGIGLSVCKQDYRLTQKSYERILMKFSGAVGCIHQEEVIRFWDQLPQLSSGDRVNNVKWVLGGSFFSLSECFKF